MQFFCAKYGRRESAATRKPHCPCGGLWDLAFQPPAFSLEQVETKEWSQFRYRNFMALEHLLASGCISHMPQIIALQRQNCDPLLRSRGAGLKSDH